MFIPWVYREQRVIRSLETGEAAPAPQGCSSGKQGQRSHARVRAYPLAMNAAVRRNCGMGLGDGGATRRRQAPPRTERSEVKRVVAARRLDRAIGSGCTSPGRLGAPVCSKRNYPAHKLIFFKKNVDQIWELCRVTR
jgi:hypothetical protein